QSLNALIGNYFFKTLNQPCILNYTFTIHKDSTWLAISKMVQSGVRYPIQWETKKDKDKIFRKIHEVEFAIDLQLQIKGNSTIQKGTLLTRIQYNIKTNQMQMNSPPWFQSDFCNNIFVLKNICGCFG
uniref:Uncharacterized protein n=1 Tax=Panagrolaimus sp. JU765 TaxID=591449 RepID=A0AC34R5B5_9BILA